MIKLRIIFSVLLCMFLFSCQSIDLGISAEGKFVISQKLQQGYFNEVITLYADKQTSFKQKVEVSNVHRGKWVPLVSHRLYTSSLDKFLEFRLFFYEDHQMLAYRYMVRNDNGEYNESITDKKLISTEKEFELEIKTLKGKAKYLLNGQEMFSAPLLHEVAYLGTLYSSLDITLTSNY